MAKDDVLTLVTDFSLNVADADETDVLYDEVVRELGFLEVLTSTETQVVEDHQAVVVLATDTIRLLELYSSEGGRLDSTTVNMVRAILGNNWRDQVGYPRAYVQDQENDNTVRLVPKPVAPLQVTAIRSDSRTDVPVWLELPLALEILSREMSRESDHQDIAFGAACAQFSRLLFNILGVSFNAQEEKR